MKKVLLVVVVLVILVVSAVAIYGYALLNMVNQVPLVENPDDVSEPNSPTLPPKEVLDREDLSIPEDAPSPEKTGVINILLFGLDRRAPNEGARSDAMMIATIDKKNRQVKLTSLMRDMYVSIPGKQDNRINTG